MRQQVLNLRQITARIPPMVVQRPPDKGICGNRKLKAESRKSIRMNKCPKCGHEWPAKNQAKGGKNRWKGMTKKQRSEEMKRVRAKGISKGKK
jgi:hypothetical protein